MFYAVTTHNKMIINRASNFAFLYFGSWLFGKDRLLGEEILVSRIACSGESL